MKSQLFTVKYLGYDNKKNVFVFDLKNSMHYLFASEVSWNTPAPKLIQDMKDKVGRLFKLLIYHLNYGYYIEYENRKYVLYDGVTSIATSHWYSNFSDIPKSFGGKPVYRYKKRAIISEVTGG